MSTTEHLNSSREPSGFASGVSVFAGTMLATLASFQFLQGLSAVSGDGVFASRPEYTYEFDVTAWGWFHVIWGVIGMIVGIGIYTRRVWANIAGIGFAVLSMLSQFAFLPYYPFWALLIIGFDVLVIWALATIVSRTS